MRKVLFVYNPNAGKGRILHHLDEVVNIFEQEGFQVALYRTKGPLDGKREVQENIDVFDRIVCSGGDGTLSEIVSAMMELPEEKRKPIGFIPTGSTNDTGKSYHIPGQVTEAMKVAAGGVPFETDIGSMNDSFFTYVASFGKLSAVSAFTPQEAKRIFGYGAYLGEGIKALVEMESYLLKIEYEDESGQIHKVEGDYYLGMVTNTLSVGGFSGITGNTVDLHDGLFEVALLKRPENILDFNKQVINMFLSPDKDQSNEVVSKFKAKRLRFTSDADVQWVIDGEDGGKHKDVDIQIHPKAVRIMVKE
ncbi:MAG: diacylglycerol kinase family lipid kinase [Lachnospiraceae bacterium]|nr:diacylglycerol kinase family lipid kinase [Lachnospiraceae bacterium]